MNRTAEGCFLKCSWQLVWVFIIVNELVIIYITHGIKCQLLFRAGRIVGHTRTHAPFFLPLLPEGGKGRSEEANVYKHEPLTPTLSRLDGERELFPFGACVKIRPPQAEQRGIEVLE